MAIREGKWRCPYCAVVNRGADLRCTGCGATRDKDVQFFLEDDALEVTDEALLAKAQAGADWLCQFCQTSNTPDLDHCRNCGALRGTSPSRAVRDIPDAPPPPARPAAAPTAGCAIPTFLKLAAVVVLLLTAAFCYLALRKTDDTVTVAGFEWTRSIDVEAYRTVRDSAWEGDVPSGARVVSRSREVHHTEHVQVGTKRVKVGKKDLGNGFFQDVYEDRPVYQDRPVYRIKVAYDVERWVRDRTARSAGKDHAPSWPEPALRAGEREAGRAETYVVLLRGQKDYRMDLPRDRWMTLEVGRRFHAVVRGGSTVLSIQ